MTSITLERLDVDVAQQSGSFTAANEGFKINWRRRMRGDSWARNCDVLLPCCGRAGQRAIELAMSTSKQLILTKWRCGDLVLREIRLRKSAYCLA